MEGKAILELGKICSGCIRVSVFDAVDSWVSFNCDGSCALSY